MDKDFLKEINKRAREAKRTPLTKEELAEKGGIRDEDLVNLLTKPEELEKTLRNLFNIVTLQETKEFLVNNRQERRKALKRMKKKYKKRR
jgi:hypothetical protein